jgi:CRISPR type IV-associated DEAD/DEAH-box helicase Csf4
MPVITITIGKDYANKLASRDSRAKDAARMAMLAIGEGRAPLLSEVAKSETVTIGMYFSANDHARIVSAARKYTGISVPKYVAGMVAAATLPVTKVAPAAVGDAVVRSRATSLLRLAVKQERPEQITLLGHMLDAANRKKILMAEAATGTGKGLCIAAWAYEIARTHTNERVLITGPTYQVLGQLYAEYQKFGDRAPACAVRFGRQEFISHDRLEEILEEDDSLPDAERIRKWMESGGPCTNPFGVTWFAGDLAEIAPTLPVGDATLLHDNNDDPGYLAYNAHKATSTDAQIILCTHMMLALDIQMRRRAKAPEQVNTKRKQGEPFWVADNRLRIAEEDVEDGLLPDYQYAIVDEAHMLEATFARVGSSEVSTYSLRNHALALAEHLTASAKGHANQIEHLHEQLVEIGKRSEGVIRMSFPAGSESPPDHRRISDHIRSLAKETIALRGAKVRGGKNNGTGKHERTARLNLETAATDIQRIAKHSDGGPKQITISFSPIFRYPQISAGPLTVEPALDHFWRRLKAGCAVSATLYMHVNQYHVSPAYMAKKLAIPQERITTMSPLEPAWVRKPVTVYMPVKKENGDRLWLQPISRSDSAKLTVKQHSTWAKHWYDEVAAAIISISATATGGTLVLLTSYAAIEAISAILIEKRGVKGRMIASSRDTSFSVIRERYVQSALSGDRPVWLATGPAWVGMDVLRGLNIPARDDLIITDLVIPRFPTGITNTTTHQHRMALSAQWGAVAERYETAVVTKQALGRPVRQSGVPPRRYYLLDSRIHTKLRGMLQPCVDMLGRYTVVSDWDG